MSNVSTQDKFGILLRTEKHTTTHHIGKGYRSCVFFMSDVCTHDPIWNLIHRKVAEIYMSPSCLSHGKNLRLVPRSYQELNRGTGDRIKEHVCYIYEDAGTKGQAPTGNELGIAAEQLHFFACLGCQKRGLLHFLKNQILYRNQILKSTFSIRKHHSHDKVYHTRYFYHIGQQQI